MPRTGSCRIMLLSSALVCLVGVGGCDSSGGRKHSYRLNPSPELDTLSETHDEIENQITINYDYNLRMLNSDIGRFFMLDRPSRLTNHEVNW